MQTTLTWTKFKAMQVIKKLKVQYNEVDGKDIYYVFMIDNNITYKCSIDKDTAEATDFETTYMANSNLAIDQKDIKGNTIISPTISSSMGYKPKKKSYMHSVDAGKINFFDTLITSERYLAGGEYWINPADASKVNLNDYIEFSVIDKDGVMINPLSGNSYFDDLGLTVGVDILELDKFVINDYVIAGNPADGYHTQCFEGITGTSYIYEGLYFRVCYQSFGTQDLMMIARTYYYRD